MRPCALVTGAAYGIGAATAVALARDGHDVVAADLPGMDLSNTLRAIGEAGGQAAEVRLDLRDQASLEAGLAAAVESFGRLDVLVNNAGVPSLRKPAVEITRDEWNGVLNVNLTGTFFMSCAMARHLIAAGRPGAIVSIASTHGVVGFPGASAYGVAKAGIAHMTRILALEWVEHGIRVNAVAPGSTATPSRRTMSDPEHRRRMEARIPLGRLAEPEEVAAAVVYLAGMSSASYVTGHTLMVDGGLTAA